jgi:hypothetical protein
MTPSNTTASIPSSRDHLGNNDNSNPQQGTALTPSAVEPTPPETQMESGNETTSGRANTMRSQRNKKDYRKLFVGGLPADVTEDEFLAFFEQFGEVVDSVVMFDRETHRSRGFGFVTFQSSEVANRLLNMGQGEDENRVAASEDSTNAPRVGRLVMRGKTCEVKTAEPKESSRSNRRSFQNQGGSSGAPNRRFVDKSYSQGGHPPSVPHANPYHDPHYMAGYHYHMVVSPSYHPDYYPGMYHEAAGYHPAPMYAPVAHTGQVHDDGLHQPYVPPVIATPVNGALGAPYMEAPQGTGHAYAAYGHPHMMQPVYPTYSNMYDQPAHTLQGAYPAPGTPSSVMQPAAPGLPTKDE